MAITFTNGATPLVEVEALSFGYAGTAFRIQVESLRVDAREKVAVIGPSGSGKTTLLNLIAGILVPGSGRVRVGGVEISGLRDSARREFRIARIGFVFQAFELLEYLTVLDNVLHPYRITGALRCTAPVRDRARQLGERLGVGGYLRRHPDQLSQGERQRVAICRALVTEPDLILADEATGHLDPDNKAIILELLFAAADEQGAGVLAVTHDHELLPRFDRVVDFRDFHGARA